MLQLPVVMRPAFTLGGHGGGFAHTPDELEAAVTRGLRESPIGQVLLEESVAGWGEFELEVIRDRKDNVVIVCSIENVDPMGVHTGDSATVAPAQTLSDREYQTLRDASADVIRAVGVETGGSNVQFALNREHGDLVVIEMNPRVSRSSALASKATGYPIAKVATKLAIGYTLDEIPNDITRTTPAAFEPTLDYVVVKLPRFAFEKFPGADTGLTTQMKSVGEVMGIGRTFAEAWGKAMRSRELDGRPRTSGSVAEPEWDRFDAIQGRLTAGEDPAALAAESSVHLWFLDEWERIAHAERMLTAHAARVAGRDGVAAVEAARPGRRAHRRAGRTRRGDVRAGCASPPACARCTRRSTAAPPRSRPRRRTSTRPTRRRTSSSRPSGRASSSSAPGRTGSGRGSSSTTAACAPSQTFRELGYDAVMINCNPETVSTDADSSDRLYFEPLTVEDVLEVVERERPVGVVVQFGGQTPLRLARRLEQAGVPILGTPFAAIDVAEDRERFGQCAGRARPARAGLGHRRRRRRGRRDRQPHRLPGARAAELRARRARDADLRRRRVAAGAAGAAGVAGRPVRRRRDRGRRRRHLRRRAHRDRRRSWSTSRRRACTPATRPASSRRCRWASGSRTSCGGRPPPSPRRSACAG